MNSKIIVCLALAVVACIPVDSCPVSLPGIPSCLPPCPPPCLPPCLPQCAAPAPCVAPPTTSSQVFPVILDNCGPNPCPLPVLNAPTQQAPCIEKPVIPLPACIPAPKTISNVANCVKTVVKPQVYQQVIAQPSVQRYIETSHTPVVENINYHAVPVNCPPIAPEAAFAEYAAAGLAPCAPLLPPCAPLLPPCLPALPPCLPALPPCLPAPIPPCAPVLPPCLPALPPCLPAPIPPCAPVFPPCVPPCF